MSNRPSSDRAPRLGAKVRALRRKLELTQAQMAERLGISGSYLNLIEADKRPLTADLLIRLARDYRVDLASFAADEDTRVVQDLVEVFADPLFADVAVGTNEVRDLVEHAPLAARSVLALYRRYRESQSQADALAARLDDTHAPDLLDRSQVSSEEVSDLLQRHLNHFPALEASADELWQRAGLKADDLYPGLLDFLERSLDVRVRRMGVREEPGVLRRFDPHARTLWLSELLPTRDRTFQMAHTIGLLTLGDVLDGIVHEEALSVPESRALARVALANYFAGAVVMPYARFLEAAQETRYDLDLIGRRFRVSFEQVAHRLTTLRRPGAEGIPFHYIRIDVAGNISKRFSASGIRIARFSGACPRWNVFAAFLTPGLVRVQLSEMPEGDRYFCIARMIHRDAGGYHHQPPAHAIGLGCRLEHARELVYADGIDLDQPRNVVPVGVNCRVCERADCEQRALPSLRQPLQVDERIRRVSPYARARE